MKNYKIALIPGDGIGPEVTNSARQVLEATAARFGFTLNFDELLAGGIAIDATGEPLPEATVEGCKKSNAVLLGAVGGPKWDNLPGDKRPERALLGLRSELGLYSNLRPAILFPSLVAASPLHPDISSRAIDMLIVRELTGGLYFGEQGRRQGKYGLEAYDTEAYSKFEIERIVRQAFALARKRKKHLTSVDKANILESSRLWRETAIALNSEYPDVALDHLYVDNAAMQLIRRPDSFDVIVTGNMFGDILSDEAAMLTGSIGMLPSASLGEPGTPGLYEPVHGSAPDIAGQDKANPLAAIMSAALMLSYSLGEAKAAGAIEGAVNSVLETGWRTADIALDGETDCHLAGTKEICDQVVQRIKEK